MVNGLERLSVFLGGKRTECGILATGFQNTWSSIPLDGAHVFADALEVIDGARCDLLDGRVKTRQSAARNVRTTLRISQRGIKDSSKRSETHVETGQAL